MKILFDMRTVQQHLNRGIGYYCLGLIEGLASVEGVRLGYLLDHRRAPLPPDLPQVRAIFRTGFSTWTIATMSS